MPGPYYTLESLEANNSVGYLIKRCGILMTQIAEQRFESQSISFTQWVILIQLAHHPHQSPTEISKHIGYDMGALTRIVDDLEKKKLVNRERSERDRRAVEIALTPEGRRLAFSAKAHVVELANSLVEPFTRAETDMLISLLQRLLQHMEAVESRVPAEGSGEAKSLPIRSAAGKAARGRKRSAP
jgi:DNA-binding MarR family transcriptional regulator